MPFEKGKSGNPAGKKPGTAKVAPLREAIAQHVPGIIATLVGQAQSGDVAAARLLLERALPALKPVQEPMSVNMPGETLTAKATAVVDAIGRGELSPSDGKLVLDGLSGLAKIIETEELKTRVELLERSLKANQTQGK